MMSKGRCLNVAAGVVSSFRWGTRLRRLPSAAPDAEAFAGLAASRAFETVTLMDEQAGLDEVRREISAAAAALISGDTFLLTFNGHGLAGIRRGLHQQSWCLFDAPLTRFGGDGLDSLLASFDAGVRIFVVANCCHSGTPAGPTLPTPQIRAHVVRLSVCGVGENTMEPEETAISAFAARVLAAAAEPRDFGSFLTALSDPVAQLEISDPRDESFLATGPFRLPKSTAD